MGGIGGYGETLRGSKNQARWRSFHETALRNLDEGRLTEWKEEQILSRSESSITGRVELHVMTS